MESEITFGMKKMKLILKIGKWVLLVWGGLSLVAVTTLAIMFAYRLNVSNQAKPDEAKPQDVRFVLNWCNLGDNRIEKVLHSHVSARSFTGDHLDAYAIKITNVTLDELTTNKGASNGRWYRGDQLPKVLDDAVTFVGEWQHEIDWFPTEAELRSTEIYVYPWSIYCHGVSPSAAAIIFVRPKDKMVFFFDGKT